MREMKESSIEWVGKIPDSWRVMPNKWIMHKQKELCEKYNNEDILSLTMKGVIIRDLNDGGKIPATFDGYQIVYPNNLLMCLFDYDVTPRCIGLIKNKGLTSPAYSQFVMDGGNCSNYYYYYYLMVDNTKELLHLAKNLRHSFTEEQLGEIYTPVPPINEQEKIARYLDKKTQEIDSIIEYLKKTIEDYKKYKNSLITEIVTNGLKKEEKLKESGIDWIGKIPKSWEILPINECFRERNERVSDTIWEPLSVTKQGILKQLETAAKSDAHEDRKKVCKNDFVINSRSDRKQSCGVSPYDGSVSLINIVLENKKFDNRFVHYLLKNYGFAEEFYKYGSGIVADLWSTNYQKMKKIMIPVPSLKEQCEIVEFLDKKINEINVLISKKETLIEEMEQYKKSLIYEYVTGKKEVV